MVQAFRGRVDWRLICVFITTMLINVSIATFVMLSQAITKSISRNKVFKYIALDMRLLTLSNIENNSLSIISGSKSSSVTSVKERFQELASLTRTIQFTKALFTVVHCVRIIKQLQKQRSASIWRKNTRMLLGEMLIGKLFNNLLNGDNLFQISYLN